MWNIFPTICVASGVAATLIILLFTGALWVAEFPNISLDKTVRATTLFELLKLIFAIVAGIGGVVALVVAYRRQRVAEAANELAEMANTLAHASDDRARAAERRADIELERSGIRLLNERFAKAAELLGSESAAIRLAGVYALTGLADDWDSGRQVCIDVLCGYIRMPPRKSQVESGDHSAREDQVRKSILRVIASRLRPDSTSSWAGCEFDFTGATLKGVELVGARIPRGTRMIFRKTKVTDESLNLRKVVVDGGVIDFDSATFLSTVILTELELTKGVISFHNSSFGDALWTPKLCILGGQLTFKGATFSAEYIRFGGFHDNAIGIRDGNLVFDHAHFESTRSTSFDLHLQGGKVSFSGTTFMGREFSLSDSKIGGGLVDFEFSTFEVSDIDLTDIEFTGGVIDLSRPQKWNSPPTLPSRISGELRLPEPNWRFEEEPPF